MNKFKPAATSYLSSKSLADELHKARRIVEQAGVRVHRSKDLIIASKKAVERAREAAGETKKPA